MQTQTRMTLWGIEIFLAVVEEGSISLAAKRLEVSSSSISQQITNLEAALGVRLIDRAARPLTLTPPGMLFLRRAQMIFSEAAQARSELAMHDLSELTRLRLGMIEDFDADVTPRLLADMSEDLKSCHFVLETGASLHLAAMLESRALDIIVAADLDLTPDWMPDWMEVHPLIRDPFMVVAPLGAINQADSVLIQLLNLPFIRYSARQMMGRQIESHLVKLGLSIPHRFELDSYHAIMAMVAGGAGWTITTPLGYTRAQRFCGDVAVMPLPIEPLSRRISLFARREAMDTMPADIANRLRPLLSSMVVEPSVAQMPWLAPDLEVC
ncbi:MAG: LysR family transcriptional regulator [Alphaproteobacteria bacterium]|nr:LysR family transcriptional regulator [Alphaproteobacteria bacterium]